MICRSGSFSLLITIALASALAAQAPQQGSITIDRIAAIKYPTDPAWSPNSEQLAFLWDAAGKQDLFVVTPGEAPVQLTDFDLDPDMLVSDIGRFAWRNDNEILFAHGGQLWRVSPSSRAPTRVAGFENAADFTLSPDRNQIAFARDGEVWVGSLLSGSTRLLLTLPEPLTASDPIFSREGDRIAFSASHRRVLALPEEEMSYNGNRVRQYRTVTTDQKVGIVSTFGGDPVWIDTPGPESVVDWAADSVLVFEVLSPDRKTRAIKRVLPTSTVRTLWTDHDPAWWWRRPGANTAISPDGRSVAFFSDQSGWLHLYVLPFDAASTEQARPLTSGNYEATDAAWSPDGESLAFAHAADGNAMERFISMVNVASGKVQSVVTLAGVNFRPLVSPDGRRIAYHRTSVEHPLELYAVPTEAGRESTRLTHSLPQEIELTDLTRPEPVQFPSRFDDQPVPGTLIVPESLDRNRRHPAIVWIHGSGSDQNFLGWHPGNYRMYYAMHQYLAQQGYVIITPDHRGSSGYGREWATGSYLDIGGSEALDVLSAADYLTTLDFIDPARICVWGLSYGGFLTLQTMLLDPTLFACGINVAGVTDWVTHAYTNGTSAFRRMGTPEQNPEGYERSAPVRNIEKLVRPLLILHGTNDTNVPLHESLQLMDRLVKLGKPFEVMIYPGETHFFRRGFVLRDAWRRVEAFFDRHLKPEGVPPSRVSSGR